MGSNEKSIFSQNVPLDTNFETLQKKNILTEEVRLDTQNGRLTNPHKKLAKDSTRFCSQSQINAQTLFFFKKKHFSSNFSKCQEVHKVFIKRNVSFIKEFFSRKIFSKNVECSFDNPVEKNRWTSKNVLLRSESHDGKSYYPIAF